MISEFSVMSNAPMMPTSHQQHSNERITLSMQSPPSPASMQKNNNNNERKSKDGSDSLGDHGTSALCSFLHLNFPSWTQNASVDHIRIVPDGCTESAMVDDTVSANKKTDSNRKTIVIVSDNARMPTDPVTPLAQRKRSRRVLAKSPSNTRAQPRNRWSTGTEYRNEGGVDDVGTRTSTLLLSANNTTGEDLSGRSQPLLNHQDTQGAPNATKSSNNNDKQSSPPQPTRHKTSLDPSDTRNVKGLTRSRSINDGRHSANTFGNASRPGSTLSSSTKSRNQFHRSSSISDISTLRPCFAPCSSGEGRGLFAPCHEMLQAPKRQSSFSSPWRKVSVTVKVDNDDDDHATGLFGVSILPPPPPPSSSIELECNGCMLNNVTSHHRCQTELSFAPLTGAPMVSRRMSDGCLNQSTQEERATSMSPQQSGHYRYIRSSSSKDEWMIGDYGHSRMLYDTSTDAHPIKTNGNDTKSSEHIATNNQGKALVQLIRVLSFRAATTIKRQFVSSSPQAA